MKGTLDGGEVGIDAVKALENRIDSLLGATQFDPTHATSQAIVQVIQDHREALTGGHGLGHGYAAEAWALALRVVGEDQAGHTERGETRANEAMSRADGATNAANLGWIGTAREVVERVAEIAFPAEERDRVRQMLNRAGSATLAAQRAWARYDEDWNEGKLKGVVALLGCAEGAYRIGRMDVALDFAEQVLAQAGHLSRKNAPAPESLLEAPEDEE